MMIKIMQHFADRICQTEDFICFRCKLLVYYDKHNNNNQENNIYIIQYEEKKLSNTTVWTINKLEKQVSTIVKKCDITALPLIIQFYIQNQNLMELLKAKDGFKIQVDINHSNMNQLISHLCFISFKMPTLNIFYKHIGYLFNHKRKGKLSLTCDRISQCDFEIPNNFYQLNQLQKIIEKINDLHKSNPSYGGPLKSNNWLPVISYEVEPLFTPLNDLKKAEINQLQCQWFEILLDLSKKFEKQANIINLFISQNTNSKKKSEQSEIHRFKSTTRVLRPNKIYNPHFTLKLNPKQKYIYYFTKGLFQYYHYGDQNFNDHGWGCAYRALQTLLSWFKLQNKIGLEQMISLPQIQQIIDNMSGSKQKLKDSREWIGATQVSWVISKLSGYDCRIIHISDGQNIMQHCQMFRQHFSEIGCPIMYGGGQYAYSIIGLHYSWKLGECQFLILDPHYTDADDFNKITSKKGICWKKSEQMFKKGTFYNFCLPIINDS